MPGMFIAFEGPDGAGKTTQVALAQQWFDLHGYATTVTRQPGGTPAGAAMRRILLDPSTGDLDDIAEAFLFAADRAQHVRDVVRPALARGEVVLTDRYIDSSVAYQGFGRGLGAPFVRDINTKATRGLLPDLTIILDLPVEVTLRRVYKGGVDRIEAAGAEFFHRVRDGLLACARNEPNRYVVIDAAQSVEAVSAAIQTRLSALLDHASHQNPAAA